MNFRNYTSIDYLEYEDLNQIEDAIVDLLNKISALGIQNFEYNDKTWELNEPVNSDNILNIINGIQKFKDEYVNFSNMVDLKQYRNRNTIDYKEVNDWITNLRIMYNNYQNLINYNIWNYHYLLNWNENSTIEWEE